jgi:membrane associated rhomboid family serine protease
MEEKNGNNQNPEKKGEVKPGKLSDVVKFLIYANILIFILQLFAPEFGFDIMESYALYNFRSENFSYHQLISHMFLHGNLMHIFLNMFILWMFGSALEYVWHSRKFLFYYFFTGLGAAVLHLGVSTFMLNRLESDVRAYAENPGIERYSEFLEDEVGAIPEELPPHAQFLAEMKELEQKWAESPQEENFQRRSVELVREYFNLKLNIPTVGASGAVFGLLLAFGFLFPDVVVYIYFLFPMKAKYFIILLGFLELYFGVFRDDNIANFAHLGGMIFGFVLLKVWGERPRQVRRKKAESDI